MSKSQEMQPEYSAGEPPASRPSCFELAMSFLDSQSQSELRGYIAGLERAAQLPPAALRSLIADDAYAATFQTMAQYRSALLAASAQPPPVVEQARSCGLCGGLGCRMCGMTGKYIADVPAGPFACENCNRLAREAHTWSKALEETIKRERATQPPLPEQWQPIETAPKNDDAMFWIRPRTRQETWRNSSGEAIVIDSPPQLFFGKYGRWSSLWTATHWMPLPSGPTKEVR